MKLSLSIFAVLLLLPLGACATSFRGSANISPHDCYERCDRIGASMSAYVYMGDYSTACVCEPPAAAGRRAANASAVTGAVAGVWMQMQEAQRQSQN